MRPGFEVPPQRAGHASACSQSFARSFLATYARCGRGGGPRAEPGPVVLAVLLARAGTAEDTLLARAAVRRWAQDALAHDVARPGLHDGGLAGMVVGLRLGATLHPPLASIAERVRVRLGTLCARRPWRTESIGFEDYDLVSGPAGVVLGLGLSPGGSAGPGARPGGSASPGARPGGCAHPDTSRTPRPRVGPGWAGAGARVASGSAVARVALHLAGLCAGGGTEDGAGVGAELPRLRIGEFSGRPWPEWFLGRVNLGLAHGVPGVLLALSLAVRTGGDDAGAIREPLGSAAACVAGAVGRDAHGCPAWGAVAGDGDRSDRRRQGWCYGTPGVSWALWEAANVLDDPALRRCAEDAFGSLAERFDPDRHVFGTTASDRLGVCHGAAGVLAVADAFARHARLPAAVALRTTMTDHLREGLARAARTQSSVPDDSTLLGLLGAHAVLLTPEAGAPEWLGCLGLR